MEATATTTNTKTTMTMTIKVRYVAANPVCNKRQKPQATQVFARVPSGIFFALRIVKFALQRGD